MKSYFEVVSREVYREIKALELLTKELKIDRSIGMVKKSQKLEADESLKKIKRGMKEAKDYIKEDPSNNRSAYDTMEIDVEGAVDTFEDRVRRLETQHAEHQDRQHSADPEVEIEDSYERDQVSLLQVYGQEEQTEERENRIHEAHRLPAVNIGKRKR